MRSTSRTSTRARGAVAVAVALGLTISASAAGADEDGRDGAGSGLQRETTDLAPRDDKAPSKTPNRGPTEVGAQGLADAIDAYQRVHPDLTRDQARAAATGQEARKQLWDDVLADHTDTFGGAWFDPGANTLHVNVTDNDVAEKIRSQAKDSGLSVQTHLVDQTFEQLSDLADDLRASKDGLGEAAAGRVGLDVRANQVVVQVPERALGQARKSADGRVRVEVAVKRDVEADACTDRNSCPDAVRSGSILWKGSVGNDWCSAAATAVSSTTHRRYVITAGHCVGANGEYWGTSNRYIGTRWAAQNSGDVDAATIWVRYWPFANQSNGEIWGQWQSDRAVDMDGVAPTQSWIWEGDIVCLAANYTDPDATGNRCGVVGANQDASVRGMTRVDGIDACGGDSGGGWYWLTSSGNRYGYGVHSRSDTGCNGSAGGDSSWFTSLPRVKTWIPSLEYETQ